MNSWHDLTRSQILCLDPSFSRIPCFHLFAQAKYSNVSRSRSQCSKMYPEWTFFQTPFQILSVIFFCNDNLYLEGFDKHSKRITRKNFNYFVTFWDTNKNTTQYSIIWQLSIWQRLKISLATLMPCLDAPTSVHGSTPPFASLRLRRQRTDTLWPGKPTPPRPQRRPAEALFLARVRLLCKT